MTTAAHFRPIFRNYKIMDLILIKTSLSIMAKGSGAILSSGKSKMGLN